MRAFHQSQYPHYPPADGLGQQSVGGPSAARGNHDLRPERTLRSFTL